VVIIGEPDPGDTPLAGTIIPVSVTTYGENPIANVELWMDGILIEAKESPTNEGLDLFTARFFLPVPEGEHTISALGIDTFGIIGKSAPLGILGRSTATEDELTFIVQVEDGDTLETIASANHSDPATLQTLNPALGGNQPTPGTSIIVPFPKETGAPAFLPPAANPPQPIPNTPMLSATNFFDVVFEPLVNQISLLQGGLPGDGPKDLYGKVDGCQVRLIWVDYATDESRYEVWTAWNGLEPRLVASLEPAPNKSSAWYDFESPQAGRVTFWVEAVTSTGNRASNDVVLIVPQGCEPKIGGDKYLIVQVYDLTTNQGYQNAYCYVSIDNKPEQRVPSKDGEFVPLKNGKASFGGVWTGWNVPGPYEKLVPIPASGSLEIEGQCLAWAGGWIIDLGKFNGKFPVQDWDGSRKTLKGQSFTIEFAIKPYTQALGWAMSGKYWYEDFSLPTPYDLKIGSLYSPFPASQSNIDPRERVLSWKWDGDPKSITGFKIDLDGKHYKFVPGGDTRQTYILEPTYCGHGFTWAVSAVSGPGVSRTVQQGYVQPNCQAYAMVVFKDIHFLSTGENLSSGQCDNLEIYGSIGVESPPGSMVTFKDYGMSQPSSGGCIGCKVQIHCLAYSFNWLGTVAFGLSNPDKLVIPLPNNPAQGFQISPVVRFYDHDNVGMDFLAALHYPIHTFSSLKNAQDTLGCGKQFSNGPVKTSHAESTITYELSVYPNTCLDFPIGVPLPVPPWAPNK